MAVPPDIDSASGHEPAGAAATAERDRSAVACRGLWRSFGSTHALRGIDLEIPAGTVHGLVGQNGAGKSTCLGVVAGRVAPTGGEVQVFGETFRYGNPRAAQALGVAAVYQELTVIPQLTPQANALLSDPSAGWGWQAPRDLRRRYEQACEELGIPPAPDVPAGQLPVASQQLIEIVRAVSAQARLILLDEPTTALSIGERDALFALVASLKARGVTVILVSHNLDEVLAHTDAVTVFREGEVVATRPSAEWTKQDLVHNMLGPAAAQELVAAELDGASVAGEAPGGADERAAPVLRATGVSLPGRLDDATLELRPGEVLGIGGLMGSGRSSLLRALAGAEPETLGRLEIDGRRVGWPRSPRAARRLGIGFIPEDRKADGLVLGMSASDNVVVGRFGPVTRLGYLAPRRVLRHVRPLLSAAGVEVARARTAARNLSGGNQQKLLFARSYHQRPRILLCDEPTRGIDIGAKTDLLQEIRRLAREEGLAVVLVSSELEEVTAFSDRVLVLAQGRTGTVFDSGRRAVSPSDILHEAFGLAEGAAT